jgi:tetratricopeptide (TPR) repeat protein
VLDNASTKTLIEQAELLVEIGELQEALERYNRLVETGPPHPYFFKRRATIHSLLEDWTRAIEDARRAIELNPDDADIYISIGVYMTWDLFSLKEIVIHQHTRVLEQVIHYYKESLERDPTSFRMAEPDGDLSIHAAVGRGHCG